MSEREGKEGEGGERESSVDVFHLAIQSSKDVYVKVEKALSSNYSTLHIKLLLFHFLLPLSTLQYITKLMEWIEKQINNEDIFPSEVGESCITHRSP